MQKACLAINSRFASVYSMANLTGIKKKTLDCRPKEMSVREGTSRERLRMQHQQHCRQPLSCHAGMSVTYQKAKQQTKAKAYCKTIHPLQPHSVLPVGAGEAIRVPTHFSRSRRPSTWLTYLGLG